MYLAPICSLESIRHNRADFVCLFKLDYPLATYTLNDPPSVIRTFPDLAMELVKMMSSATSDIHLASRYYEPAIGNRLLAKFAEGVSIHVLDANASGVSLEERMRAAMTHDVKNRQLMSRLLDSKNAIIRAHRLPYSFVVVDRRLCGVELTDPRNPDNFQCAVRLENSELAEELIGMFESLAQSVLGNPHVSSPVM